VALSLSRVGVSNLRRNIQIATRGKPVLFQATLDLFADLNPNQAGVHMSRFSDAVESLVQEMTLEPSPDIESLAGRLSKQVVADQRAIRSEVRIRARSPINKTSPVSGKTTQELYDLIGIASSTATRTRCLVGVEAEGMTVCPCAQDMVRADSRQSLPSSSVNPLKVPASKVWRKQRVPARLSPNRNSSGAREMTMPFMSQIITLSKPFKKELLQSKSTALSAASRAWRISRGRDRLNADRSSLTIRSFKPPATAWTLPSSALSNILS
jgi:GTP cyclohydrolase FolE2